MAKPYLALVLALFAVIGLVCCSDISFAKEHPRKKSEVITELHINREGEIIYGPKTEVPADDLFRDPAAFCEGCYGLVMEVSKLLNIWTREEGSMKDHVDTASYAACRNDRLTSYVLSPPKMVKLCTGILAHYNEEFTTALLLAYTQSESPSREQLVTGVCRKAVPACGKGTKPMSVSREEDRKKKAEATNQEL